MALDQPTCFHHPARAAGWECALCTHELCADCTAWVFNDARAHVRMPACVHCRGYARPLRQRRAVSTPFAGVVLSALPWAFARASLVAALSCTVIILLGSFLGAGWLFEFAVLGYLFDVARSTARGDEQAPMPEDFQGIFRDMLDPALRLLVSVVWCWGAYSLLSMSSRWNHPWAWLVLLLLSACYVPTALLVAAARAPLLQLANPLAIVRSIARLGRDALRLSLFCLFLLALAALLRAFEGRFGGTAVFGLIGVNLFVVTPCVFLFCILGLAAFRAAGLLLRLRGDEIGYGSTDLYLEPILGDAEPRGVLTPPELEIPSLPSAQDALQADLTNQPAAHRDEAEFELAPDSESGSGIELAQRVVAGDWDGAVELLTAAQGNGVSLPAILLSAQSWLALGQQCAARSQPRLALFSLRRATEISPGGPSAPQALLLAARIFAEQLQDAERCAKTLRELTRRFPQSREAEEAAEWFRQQPAKTS